MSQSRNAFIRWLDFASLAPRLSVRQTYLAIALLGLWVAAAGTADIPLNGHEVYVAETAREMQERGDWLIPYFNGELRLNKPPLNYWATGAIAWLSGHAPIQDWHARAVSALAGMGLAVFTLLLGNALFSDRRVGLLGGLLLTSSMGYFAFSHDARPDMLYALGCVAGLAALAEGWHRLRRQQGTALCAYLMWLAFAMATLAKGPHVPAMLLAASAGFLRWHERLSWRAIAGLLRPLGGILLLALIAGPWWWLLRRHIGGETLGHSQLGGSLLTVDWRQILNPYHFLRVLQLLLPWSLLLPFALTATWKQKPLSKESLWLLTLIGVAAIVLGFGSQRRWFYMLPLLPPLCLVLAEILVKLYTGSANRQQRLPLAHAGLWLLVTAAVVALFFRPGCCGEGNLAKLAAALGLASAWLAVLGLRGWRRMENSWRELAGSSLTVALMLVLLSDSPALWSVDRFYLLEAVKTAGKEIGADTPAVALDENPMAYIFYLRRNVARVDGMRQLNDYLNRADRAVLAIVDSRQAEEVLRSWPARRLAAMPDDAQEPKTLLLLPPPSRSP